MLSVGRNKTTESGRRSCLPNTELQFPQTSRFRAGGTGGGGGIECDPDESVSPRKVGEKVFRKMCPSFVQRGVGNRGGGAI